MKIGNIIKIISALPPPHAKQQSTTVFFKFKQVTHPRDCRLGDHENVVTMVMIVVMVKKILVMMVIKMTVRC